MDSQSAYTRTFKQWFRGIAIVGIVSVSAGVGLGTFLGFLANTFLGFLRESANIGADAIDFTTIAVLCTVLGLSITFVWGWFSRPRVLASRSSGVSTDSNSFELWFGADQSAVDGAADSREEVVRYVGSPSSSDVAAYFLNHSCRVRDSHDAKVE